MNFHQFAEAHGLIIDRSLVDGRICRCKTTDKPHHKNGAYLFNSDFGWVQNHATMTEPAIWHPDREQPVKIDRAAIAKQRAATDRVMRVGREQAAKVAKAILGECEQTQHAYLDSKGFPELRGAVYRPDADNLLVVPMYVGKKLVGCQTISIDGGKKFIHGQQAKGAEFVIGSGDLHAYCEGYATGLSIHAAAKQRLSVHVCFSAGNLTHMAREGFVVADNDASDTGRKAAVATGLPYFMPPTIGHDFNDFHREHGLFRATMALNDFLRENRLTIRRRCG